MTVAFRLGAAPPLWWDEGWTLAVAKNMLEIGHFGQINDGLRLPPGLSGHPPVILAALAGFRLFGVGIWQGRLPFALLTLLALFFLFRFTALHAGRQGASGALLAALLLVPRPMIHPILNGRQVLGDIPAALLILAGAWAFSRAEVKGWPFSILAAAAWGLAMFTKAQVPVFGAAALLIALLVLLIHRQTEDARRLALTALLATALHFVLARALWSMTPSVDVRPEPLQGWVDTIGIVLDSRVRARAALIFFISAVPFAAGLMVEGARVLSLLLRKNYDQRLNPAWTLVWAFTSVWMAWYLLFSNSGDRYLATPVLLAAPFAGDLLAKATAGFRWRETVRRAAALLRLRAARAENVGALFAVVLLPLLVPPTLFILGIGLLGDNQPLLDAAAFLNAETPPAGLIETYEAELLIFLQPDVHYPPDQVHIDLLRNYVYDLDEPVDYDPLGAAPDFIVIGPIAEDWRLYEPLLAAGELDLVRDFGRYRVYRPVEDAGGR